MRQRGVTMDASSGSMADDGADFNGMGAPPLAPPPPLAVEGMGLAGVSGSAWMPDEQRQLEELLAKFPAGSASATERYLTIAAQLPNKTARDVALRVRWMAAQDALRGKVLGDKVGAQRDDKDKKSKRSAPKPPMPPPGSVISRPSSSGNLLGLAGLGNSGSGSGNASGSQGPGADGSGIGAEGVNGGSGVAHPLPSPIPVPQPGSLSAEAASSLVNSMMDQNTGILHSFKANMQQCKVVENTELLLRYRDNLMASISHVAAMPGVMQQMPALPVQPNLEAAARFLPPPRPPSMPGTPWGSGMMLPPPGLMPHMMSPFPWGPTPGMQPVPGMPGSAPGSAPGSDMVGMPGYPSGAAAGMMPPPGAAMMGASPFGYMQPPPGMMPQTMPLTPFAHTASGMMGTGMLPPLNMGEAPQGQPGQPGSLPIPNVQGPSGMQAAGSLPSPGTLPMGGAAVPSRANSAQLPPNLKFET